MPDERLENITDNWECMTESQRTEIYRVLLDHELSQLDAEYQCKAYKYIVALRKVKSGDADLEQSKLADSFFQAHPLESRAWYGAVGRDLQSIIDSWPSLDERDRAAIRAVMAARVLKTVIAHGVSDS